MSAARRVEAALADRIAAALREDRSSEEITALIANSERSRARAETDREAAQVRALDPTAGVEEASAAKRKADDLCFEVDRLDSALEACGRLTRRRRTARRTLSGAPPTMPRRPSGTLWSRSCGRPTRRSSGAYPT